MHAGADFIKTSTGKSSRRRRCQSPWSCCRRSATTTMRPAADRHEAGRRHREGEARAPVPGHAARDAGRRLAHAGPVPLRRQQPRERPADADREAATPASTSRRTTSPRIEHGLRPGTKLAVRHAAGTTLRRRRAPITSASIRYGLFIDGDFVAPRKRQYFDDDQPGDGEPLARVAQADAGDVDRAVAAARRACVSGAGRSSARASAASTCTASRACCRNGRASSRSSRSLDGGKPIRESRDVDVPLAAAHFFYYAGWADKLDYAFPGRRARPLGVAGQIIPWNFPLLMAAWKIAPALACGNTVVLKPAETTPLTALKLAELIPDADLPPGVVNIVTGAGETGAALVDHPGRRQDRLHRLDGGRPADPRGWPARRSATRWSSAARRPTSSSRTPRSTRRSRASSTASSSTRATSAARARGCWCRNRWPRKSSRS